MKLYEISVATLGLVLAVAAAPNPQVSTGANLGDVDVAIRQQSAEFLKNIYAATGRPHPDGSLEVIEELIAASVPDPIRQKVTDELGSGEDGILSDGLKERIDYHILEWSLHYVPDDLQLELTTALEKYRITGQVSDNRELLERAQQYVTNLKTGRNKRGYWTTLVIAVVEILINYFFS